MTDDVYKKQIGGDHYSSMPIQASEFINKNNIPFMQRVCSSSWRRLAMGAVVLNEEESIGRKTTRDTRPVAKRTRSTCITCITQAARHQRLVVIVASGA